MQNLNDIFNCYLFRLDPLNLSMFQTLAYLLNTNVIKRLLDYLIYKKITVYLSHEDESNTCLDICIEYKKYDMLKLFINYFVKCLEWDRPIAETVNYVLH